MRTQIPALTSERVGAKLSVWLMSAANGNEITVDRIETTLMVLGMVGFTRDVLVDVITRASKEAGLDPKDALDRFLPESEVKPKSNRGRKPASGIAS